MVTLGAAEPLTSHVTAYRITQRRLFPIAWNLRADDVKSLSPDGAADSAIRVNGKCRRERVRMRGGWTRGGGALWGRIACRCTRSPRVRAVVGGSVRGSGRGGVGGSVRVVITRPVMSRPATPIRQKWCSTRSRAGPMRQAPLPTPIGRPRHISRRSTQRRRCPNSARRAAPHRSIQTPTARGERLDVAQRRSRSGCRS
jgi:hypothetical protein